MSKASLVLEYENKARIRRALARLAEARAEHECQADSPYADFCQRLARLHARAAELFDRQALRLRSGEALPLQAGAAPHLVETIRPVTDRSPLALRRA